MNCGKDEVVDNYRIEIILLIYNEKGNIQVRFVDLLYFCEALDIVLQAI